MYIIVAMKKKIKMKYKNIREITKKQRKALGSNAYALQQRIDNALSFGNETRARVLVARGKRRGYKVSLN